MRPDRAAAIRMMPSMAATGLGVAHTSTMMGRIIYSDAGMGHGATDRWAARWRPSIHQYADRIVVKYIQTGGGVIHQGE
jgi:hypothetical protein